MITEEQAKKITSLLKEKYYSHKFLAKGEHNLNYLINTKNKKYVVRIVNNNIYNNLKKEYNFLKKTEGRFGPKVYLYDDSKKILSKEYIVMEFLEGKHPKRLTNKLIEKIAEFYKELQQIKTKNKKFSLKKSLAKIKKDYEKNKKYLSPKKQEKVNEIIKELNSLFEKNEKLFSERELVAVHEDPNFGNIFYDGKKVKFVDWEFAAFDVKENDISMFLMYYKLNKEKKDLFFKTLGYEYNSLNKKRLEIIDVRNYSLLLIWMINKLAEAKDEKEVKKNKQINKQIRTIKKLL